MDVWICGLLYEEDGERKKGCSEMKSLQWFVYLYNWLVSNVWRYKRISMWIRWKKEEMLWDMFLKNILEWRFVWATQFTQRVMIILVSNV